MMRGRPGRRAVTGQWENSESTDPGVQYEDLAAFLKARPDIKVVFPLAET